MKVIHIWDGLRHPDDIDMKPVIEKDEPDCEQERSSELTLEESFVGVLGSKEFTKAPGPIKEREEILVLSKVEESVGRKTRGKKFSCKLCGMEYRHKINLVSHMRIHTGETPYCCKLCGMAFRRSDWLKLHFKIHMGEKRQIVKRFVCDKCGMKFISSAKLQSHIWKHNGERPFSCSLCEKTYYSLVNLKRHQNDRHSEEKQFYCSACGHSFARLESLQKHTRIHTGEKPFSCSECGKCYRYKYSLLMHNKLHSGKG